MSVGEDSRKYPFPISMLDSKDASLSFSGVKTALRNFIDKHDMQSLKMEDVTASYQWAIIEALSRKLKMAQAMRNLENFPIVVGGGVACNSLLRSTLNREFKNVHFVAPKYCTDNGAMIANYGLRSYHQAISFPECLSLDAKGQFVSKKDKLSDQRKGAHA